MYNFFRMQMEVIRQEDGTYTRPVLQLCWKQPIPNPPYVETGIVDIFLAEHPELESLVTQATGLAVPIAIDKLLNPPIPPEPVTEE